MMTVELSTCLGELRIESGASRKFAMMSIRSRGDKNYIVYLRQNCHRNFILDLYSSFDDILPRCNRHWHSTEDCGSLPDTHRDHVWDRLIEPPAGRHVSIDDPSATARLITAPCNRGRGRYGSFRSCILCGYGYLYSVRCDMKLFE